MIKNNFPQNLKIIRQKYNLSQEQLASKINISKQTISKYEKGLAEPNFHTLISLATTLNCSLDSLVFEDMNTLAKKTPLDLQISLDNLLSKTLENLITTLKSEIKSEINTVKSEVDYTILKFFNDPINNTDTESADEIVPNVINLEEQKERKKITYRYIDCFGNVAAGDPRCAFEVLLDTFKINSDLLSDSKEYFILKISGDSINEIFDDGEYVLIEKTSAIYDNDLIIAIIEGEATCKKIRFYDDEINLIPMSTNPNHKTQIYTSKEINICGKVVGKLSDYLEKDE